MPPAKDSNGEPAVSAVGRGEGVAAGGAAPAATMPLYDGAPHDAENAATVTWDQAGRPRSGDQLRGDAGRGEPHRHTAQAGGSGTLAEVYEPVAIGTVIADRYRLDHELGRGGMGQVFQGQHLSLDVPVAVKVMLPSVASDPVLVRRFEREARAMSALQHHNIVQVLDFGVHGRVPFLVMELLQGEPLSARLYRYGGWLPMTEIDHVMHGLCDAFEVAHGRGIIHRDLKPDNIFISHEPDGSEVVKVLDFGLAHMKDPKEAGPTLTRADMVSGTPEYMSPEQCRSLKVGPSADIYAIGCVLTEMLQGNPPFEGASTVDVMTKQMFYEAPPLRRPAEADPVPELVERLRLSLLAKRPQNRPGDITTLRQRWIQALDPAAAAALPSRKSETPAGTRDERAPQWSQAEPIKPPPSTGAMDVGLVRFVNDPEGVDEACIMGLRAHEVGISVLEPSAAPPKTRVLVLDAGEDVDRACGWLAERAGQARTGVLVCARGLSTEDMSRLIASGAGDVMAYPIAPDTLRRKIRRLLRKVSRTSR